MGTPAPLLPVHGEEECKLFDSMVRKTPGLDYDAMALEWCGKVDGVNIFPKLPAYLRTHHTAWQRNERARKAVERAAPGEAELARINAETLQQLLPPPADPALAMAAAPPPEKDKAGRLYSSYKGVQHDATGDASRPWRAVITLDGARVDLGRFALETDAAHAYDARASALPTPRPLNFPGTAAASSSSSSFLEVAQHPPLPPAAFPAGSERVLIVAGLRFGEPPARREQRGNGKRGPNKKARKAPRCTTCLEQQRGVEAETCPGR